MDDKTNFFLEDLLFNQLIITINSIPQIPSPQRGWDKKQKHNGRKTKIQR